VLPLLRLSVWVSLSAFIVTIGPLWAPSFHDITQQLPQEMRARIQL
jgi:hypothetical protein